MAALLTAVAWVSYSAGVRAGVATGRRLDALLHDRPADAAALVRLMEADVFEAAVGEDWQEPATRSPINPDPQQQRLSLRY